MVEDLHGHQYSKPFSYMSKMLNLAAHEAQGTHTYLCGPEHAKKARSILEPDKWVRQPDRHSPT
jgi:hypothetical protein